METVRIVEEAAALQNAEASIGSDFDLTPVSGTDAASELLHMPPYLMRHHGGAGRSAATIVQPSRRNLEYAR
jgi:hypothetical protein